MMQAPDDQPGWHFSRWRSPDGRFSSITIGHRGRPRPPLTVRQTVTRAIILDPLLLALYAATLMRMGQRDVLLDVLLATPLVIAVWSQWNLIRAARRQNEHD